MHDQALGRFTPPIRGLQCLAQVRIDETDLQEFDDSLIRENLSRFRETFDMLTEEEKPDCLGLILKDIVLGKDTVQLNIFDRPEFNYADGSKKRTNRLLR